ncbi:class I SAM-dependent methyltransferase [Verrucomicrobia bacterium]|nr:class I SAM-dependent methyltransferase [Verrucomicrobiota bacterium]
MTNIFETLRSLGLTSESTKVIYSEETRDVSPLRVFKDSVSGVIFIDSYYTGEDTYKKGGYRKDKTVINVHTCNPDHERNADADRRVSDFNQFYTGKRIADFGCGDGEFLKRTRHLVSSSVGIELEEDYVEALNSDGINCVQSLTEIDNGSLDVMFSFHTLEHLPNPIDFLTEMRNKLTEGGIIVVEVPHASDFLLSHIKSDEFKKFTLWSQHLVLHTRDSLNRLLTSTEFKDVIIQGVQRYPLSNHLNWLAFGKPGGHKSKLSTIDSSELHSAYEAALQRIDSTDTLIAIAKK